MRYFDIIQMPYYWTLLPIDHWSYGFSKRTHYISVLDRGLQNSRVACSVPYSAFLSWMYSIIYPSLFLQIYFLYIFCSSFIISSAVVPSSSICTVLFISKWRNAPGVSVTVTFLPSLASTAHESSWFLVKLSASTHLL